MHSDNISLPTENDFLSPESRDPDERSALQNFLGKTPEQAEEMFRKCFLSYQEDLTYMRTPAFCFYVIPAISYLCSDAADGDSDAASTFCSVMEARMRAGLDAIRPIAPAASEAVRQILARFDRFKCNPEIYGDIPARYKRLLGKLTA